MDQQVVLDKVTSLLKKKLSGSLIGIYLHGSMAMGCFNPLQSDVDILAVVKEKLSVDTYRKIANKLIRLEEEWKMVRGFEISIHILLILYIQPLLNFIILHSTK
ncbi:nucleotidyltransferase domain-containing protein [Shouchella clausii]|uniref:nucleotidyltransferase domain-containing protein n=1 Tax=Shouchella clausii TaxID=79880 RepID=UPI00211C99A7|nr:nucleotidyltransferase domain-containing protein [Shouchella clausii]